MLGIRTDTILTFLNWLLRAAIVVLVFLIVAELITNYTGAQRWGVGVILCVVGLGLYLGSVILTRTFTINHTLEIVDGKTESGTEVVPKWVSTMSLLGISALITAEILIFIYVFA